MEGGPNRTKIDLIFEKIPPIISYIMIILPIGISFFNVDLAIIYLTLFYIYFLYKSGASCIQFLLSLRKLYISNNIDWSELLEGLENPEIEIPKLEVYLRQLKELNWRKFNQEKSELYSRYKLVNASSRLPGFIQRFIFYRHKKSAINLLNQELEVLMSLKGKEYVKPSELRHIIIVPHVKEPVPILRETLNCLKNQTIDSKKYINVVLAAEAADPNGVSVSEQLKQEFKDDFDNIWITNHVLAPPDVVGKSANMNWAGREIYEDVVKRLGWDLEKTTITSCDADSKLDKQYFAYLNYKFITTPNAKYKFFTSAMIFYNNIWRLPFYARVKNSFHTISNVSNMVRPDKLVPFSTYTTTFWMIKQINFWDPWITPEDYHLFFKSVFKFNNEVSAIPLFLKTMSDAAEGSTHWETIKNNYKQSRRWAWGMSDDGWMLKNMVKNFFNFSPRATYITAHTIFNHVIGIPAAFLISLGGYIPGLFNEEFKNASTAVIFPIVSGQLIQITVVFLVIIVLFDLHLKPTTKEVPWWKKILKLVEWVVHPLTGIFLTTIPTFEAQTRLVLGKYMEYYVTIKKGGEKQEEKKDE